MRFVRLMAVTMSSALILTAGGPSRGRRFPSFEEFHVDKAFGWKRVTPILDSPFARLYRTRIRAAAAQPPNFAGKYAFAEWGCGTSCVETAVVDEETGRVYQGPLFHNFGSFRYPDGSYSLSLNFQPI